MKTLNTLLCIFAAFILAPITLAFCCLTIGFYSGLFWSAMSAGWRAATTLFP